MTSPSTGTLSMKQVLICSAAIVTVAMGIRHGFGLWLQPMTMERGWSREAFAFAFALQNLAWGIVGPVAGMLADRVSAFWVLVAGGLLYAGGLLVMALATSSTMFAGGSGLLLGMALSGSTYTIVFGVISRNIDPTKHSWAMGVTAATGSFGQFLMVPVENWLIGSFGWQNALFILACLSLAILPLAFGLKEPRIPKPSTAQQSIVAASREAFSHPSFLLLMAGYFVCGFQVVFIGIHMPSYIKDFGLTPQVATISLALIGLFNVFGTYAAGSLGARLSKPYLLSAIYTLRSVAIVTFLLVPITPWSVYVFSATMGLLWLSTVPLVNATIAQMFGVRYLSMLGGFAFLSHQIGSFLGVWLGGRLYDQAGSYDIVWWLAVGLGLVAALLSLPVRESPIKRRAQPA